MNTSLLISLRAPPILAQAAGGLAEGASKAMGIVMLIGFIFGTICVVGGGFAIRRGDTDAEQTSAVRLRPAARDRRNPESTPMKRPLATPTPALDNPTVPLDSR